MAAPKGVGTGAGHLVRVGAGQRPGHEAQTSGRPRARGKVIAAAAGGDAQQDVAQATGLANLALEVTIRLVGGCACRRVYGGQGGDIQGRPVVIGPGKLVPV
jgi:hypothetical protein